MFNWSNIEFELKVNYVVNDFELVSTDRNLTITFIPDEAIY